MKKFLITIIFNILLISYIPAKTLVAVYDPSINTYGLVNSQYKEINESSINVNNVLTPKTRNGNLKTHGDKVLDILQRYVNLNQIIVLGSENMNDMNNLTTASDYAYSQGAKILLITFNVLDRFGIAKREFYYQLKDICESYPDMLFIISAGNEGIELSMLDYKDRTDNLIVVGACDEKGEITRYSNYGEFVDIYTLGDIKLEYDVNRGTSFSAPIIAGYCSYIFDNAKEAKGKDVKKEIIKYTNKNIMISEEIVNKMLKKEIS